MSSEKLVLVTGGTGVLASHCLLQALRKGYRVRTTVRTFKRKYEVRQMMENGGLTEEQASGVEIFEADLEKDEGWDQACSGCTHVLHVANIIPISTYKEDYWTTLAQEAVLRVLRASKKAGTVKRVVLTSSHTTIGRTKPPSSEDNPLTEDDWANPKGESVNRRCKILSERAAWDWLASEGHGLEMTVINPCVMLGPMLSKRFTGSMGLINRLFIKDIAEFSSHITASGFVDVRDVAWLHLRAMTDPRAAGNRYIACSDGGPIKFKDAAKMLREDLPPEVAKHVRTETCSKMMVRFVGFHIPVIQQECGSHLWAKKFLSSKRAKADLGWEPRSAREALVATVESLIEYGICKPGLPFKD